jgi:hypothetical protein
VRLEQFAQQFNGRVRVMQALSETSSRTPVTPEFCSTWETRFNYSSVKLVMDPSRMLVRVFTAGRTGTVSLSLPSMFIFDSTGTIRWVKNGTSLPEAQAQLETILAGE